MRGVITFCVDHPKLINLLMVVVALLGVLSFKSARYEITPEMNMGVVNITTTKPGAGPEEIELAVTLVLEEELLKVDGVKKVYSKSLENMSLITLHLDQDAEDKTQVINEVQQALDRAQTRLPKDLLEKPRLDELGSNNFGVMEVHLTGTVSESLLRDMGRVLEKKLRTLPGIAGIDMHGYRKPEVEIQIDPNKRLQLGISSSEVSQALAERNIRDSGGALMSLSSEKKVLAVGQLDNPLDVKDIVLRSGGPGNEVLVGDISTVLPGYEPWNLMVLSDGSLALKLVIKKKSSADLLTVTKTLREFLAKQQEVAPPGVDIRIVDECGKLLEQGRAGNLQVKGPNVFSGYWRMPQRTAEDFTDDGFFNTGDKASIDPDGYISIVGRAKDLIIETSSDSPTTINPDQAVELRPLAKEIVQMLQPTLPSTLKFQADIDRAYGKAAVDPLYFQRIVMQLLVSARDSADPKDDITLRLQNSDYTNKQCAACRQPIDGSQLALTVETRSGNINPEGLQKMIDAAAQAAKKSGGQKKSEGNIIIMTHECDGHVLIQHQKDTIALHLLFKHVHEPDPRPDKKSSSRTEKAIAGTVETSQ